MLNKTLKNFIILFAVLAVTILFLVTPPQGKPVTLKVNNASLAEVLKQLEKQTGYFFFYETDILYTTVKLDIDVKDMPVQAVLNYCFAGQPLIYKFFDKTVVIQRKNIAGPVTPQHKEMPSLYLHLLIATMLVLCMFIYSAFWEKWQTDETLKEKHMQQGAGRLKKKIKIYLKKNTRLPEEVSRQVWAELEKLFKEEKEKQSVGVDFR